MDNMVKDLTELCETIGRAIGTANGKIRDAGGKVSNADMEYVDRLTHSLKSIKATIAMIEAEDDDGDDEYSERYSRDGGSYRRGYSREGSSYRRGYSRDGGSYDSRSYARGRGRYSSYSRDGYSRDGGLVEELRELMEQAPDAETRQEMQRLVQKMEQR